MAEDVKRRKIVINCTLIIGFNQEGGEMGIVMLPSNNVL